MDNASQATADKPDKVESKDRSYSKPCTICQTSRDVLIRCRIDTTPTWHFVCPGKCWREVSGGEVDGDVQHPHYTYGGMWKNKHEAVSAKKRKKGKQKPIVEWSNHVHNPEPALDGSESEGSEEEQEPKLQGERYTKNDRVSWKEKIYACRKSHWKGHSVEPSDDVHLWKEE